MFSQSLLFELWREVAAPPDSSASSQAVTTLELRPVSPASRDANCCWPLVSSVAAEGGSAADWPASATPPFGEVTAAAPLCVGDWADASAEAKLVDAEPEPLVPWVELCAAAAAAGENAF